MKALFMASAVVIAAMIVGCASDGTRKADATSSTSLAAADSKKSEAQLDRDMQEFVARYKEMSKNDGSTVYCASVAPTGTRMQRTVCLTQAQYLDLKEQTRELLHRLQSAPVVIPPPANMRTGPPPSP